jgi:hypothetical protein
MDYTVKLTDSEAKVLEFPGIYLHFADHDFTIVWNPKTLRQDVLKGVHTYYGSNVGEGQCFKTWQDAIHASLYDYFQYGEEFHEGDTFTVRYQGQTARFSCSGVHVINEAGEVA